MFFANRVPPVAREAYKKDAASGMLGAVMVGLTFPFFGVIARDTLKASDFEIGLLTVSPVAGYLLSLVWANMMEGRPKMPFAVWSWVAGRVLFLLAALVVTPGWFVAMVAAFWLLASMSGPAYAALMKEMYPDSDRAKIMGYARVCTLGVLAIVTVIAGPLLKGYNYRWIFPVAALFGLAAAWSFNRIPTARETTGSRSSFPAFMWSSVRILAEDGGFRWFCGGIFVSGFANFMAAPLFTIYQVDVLHVDTRWAAAYSVVAQVVSMFGYVYWGSYIDRRSSHRAVALSALMLGLIPLAYAGATEAWMLLPVMVLGGFVGSAIELAYANGILEYAPPERITHYQAVFASLMGVRGLIAPFLGVALKNWLDASWQQMFGLIAALILSSYLVQCAGIRRFETRTRETR